MVIEWPRSEMNHLQLSRLRSRRPGGVLLAVLLIAGFIFAATPIASVFAGNTCALACCAGRAPHAAGSCMDGVCHTAIRLHNKSSSLHTHAPIAEKLCGSYVIRPRTFATTVIDRREDENSQGASFHFSSFRQPCAPDCAGCAAFSRNSQSKMAALAVGNQSPAGQNKCLSASLDRADTLDVSGRQHSPRGPPDHFIV
jgi:hypothetical protein